MPEGAVRLRILIAEDDAVSRAVCRRALMELPEPPAVDAVPSVEEAVTMLRSRPYDVVLADLRMPWRTGLELLEIALREQPSAVRILMTGHPDDETVRQAKARAEVHGVLPKPLAPGEPGRTVLSLTRR